ncbi:MAG: 50S ribosomal protein L16 [Candidatus Dadabacteria bacterium]|nr:MAG: 50S ribosomal protein L16 [Candidatus Dadabacteria bacterium]
MLSPRKPKYRKQMKRLRHLKGVETRGVELSFGDYGLRALESGWITARQIEAGRIAIARHVKRGGKVWIRIFPDKPITKKPAETRMGSGKGSPEYWVAEVRGGKVLYEITGVPEEIAKGALKRAAAKMPIKCAVIERRETLV